MLPPTARNQADKNSGTEDAGTRGERVGGIGCGFGTGVHGSHDRRYGFAARCEEAAMPFRQTSFK